MPTILMIPQKQFPTQHPMLESVYTKLLPEIGYEITWLMLAGDGRMFGRTNWNGTKVILFPAPKTKWFSGLVSRALAKTCLLGYMILMCLARHFDIVQVRNSISEALIAYLLGRFLGIRFVYQFSFPVPESMIEAAREGRTRMPCLQIPLGRTQVAIRNWLLRRADLVLAISDEMRRNLIRIGVRAEQVISFPLGTDCPPYPTAREVQQLRERLGLKDSPTVLYFGTLAPERRLEFLIRVAKIVNAELADTQWLFVGDGPAIEINKLKNLAESEGLQQSILFVARVPRDEIPKFLCLATLSVSPIPPTDLFWFSSPTKTVESLAMGCPVVATNIPDQANILSESGGGLIVPYEEQAFAKAILILLRDPSVAREMGKRGEQYVRKRRSYQSLAHQVHQSYAKLLSSSQDQN